MHSYSSVIAFQDWLTRRLKNTIDIYEHSQNRDVLAYIINNEYNAFNRWHHFTELYAMKCNKWFEDMSIIEAMKLKFINF